MVALAACSSEGTEVEAAATSSGAETNAAGATLAPVVISDILPSENATVVPLVCSATGDEICNGIDDDCDDGIDETCGVSAGRLQITAYWVPGADIDIYVVDARGETLSFQRTTSVGGGELERAGRGRCEGRAVEAPSIESVRWPADTSPAVGTYEVYLHYWGECLSGAGVVDVVVSVSAGRPIGSWSQSLVPNERIRVLSFDVR